MRHPASTVLTIRVTPDLNRRLTRTARRSRQTKSETARAILERALADQQSALDPVAEARRQSLLASARASEREALQFISAAADLREWE